MSPPATMLGPFLPRNIFRASSRLDDLFIDPHGSTSPFLFMDFRFWKERKGEQRKGGKGERGKGGKVEGGKVERGKGAHIRYMSVLVSSVLDCVSLLLCLLGGSDCVVLCRPVSDCVVCVVQSTFNPSTCALISQRLSVWRKCPSLVYPERVPLVPLVPLAPLVFSPAPPSEDSPPLRAPSPAPSKACLPPLRLSRRFARRLSRLSRLSWAFEVLVVWVLGGQSSL